MDPLVDDYPGWNPYHYVMNNPVRLVDPTGLCPEGPDGEYGNCSASVLTGENARQFFKIFVETIVQTKRAVDNTNLRIENAKAFAGDVKGTAIDGANFIVREGPGFLDKVGNASAQTTLVAGSATAASLKTPTLIDTKASATATVIFAGIILVTNLTATALSGIDTAFFNGDRDEFRARFFVTTVGAVTTFGSGLLFKRELRKSILDRSTRSAFNNTATTSSSKTATDPLRNK